MRRLIAIAGKFWRALRTATGDDAYERYLAHWRSRHAKDGPPLNRRQFYDAELQRRWQGVRRCC